MQTCYNCGKQVDDTVLICPDCGALVKRYTTPTHEEQPASAPIAQNISVRGTRRIFKDENGKLHLRGGILVWLILGIFGAGYLALSMLSSIYIGLYPDLFAEVFATVPELAPLAEIFMEAIAIIAKLRWLFVLLAIVCGGKCLAGIFFTAGKYRLAYRLMLIFTGILAALFLIFGLFGYGLFLALDVFLCIFLLRNDRAMMR